MSMQVTNYQEIDSLTDISNTQKLCAMLLKTKHYQKMGEEGIFAIVTKAKSIGIDPIEALNGSFYFVSGRVGMSTEMMASLIRQKGHSITKDPKSNNEVCILHGKRGDNGDTWTISFSMQDARNAGLAKNMYDKYPATMLYNRAMSTLARQLFPDIIRGAGYTLDELKEIATNQSFPSQMEEKKDENVVELISEEQVKHLRELYDQCDPAYVNRVFAHLKRASSPIERLEDIRLDMFENMKLSAIKNVSEYYDKMADGAEFEEVSGD